MTAAVDEDANQKEAPTRRSFLSNLPKLIVYGTFAAVIIREFGNVAHGTFSGDERRIFQKAELLSSSLARLEIENIDEFNSDLRSYYRTCFIESMNHNSSPIAQALGLPSEFPSPNTLDATINEKSPEEVREEIEAKFESTFIVVDKFEGLDMKSSFLDKTLNNVRAVATTEASMTLSRMMAFEESDRGFAEILDDCLSQRAAAEPSAER